MFDIRLYDKIRSVQILFIQSWQAWPRSQVQHVKSDLASEPGAARTCLISQRDKIWSSQKVSTQSWQLWSRGQELHASTC